MLRFRHRRRRRHGRCRHCADMQETLADVLPGQEAQLKGFTPELPQERWAQLQAYGLVPGRFVRVLQHSPVTVIQVEHCEIALENELACQICVTQSTN